MTDHPQPRPRTWRRAVVPVVAVLAGAALVVGAFVVLGGRGGEQPPIVVVTGYGGDVTGVTALRDAMRDAGRDAEVAPPLGDATGDIPDQARHLATIVDETLRRTGAESVDVVGMSLGGVIVRYWVADLGGATQARRVVTLGSPHHGVDLTHLVGTDCPAACQELMPDSDLLRGLNRDETPAGPSWVALWSTHDTIVTPPASARLSGALSFSVQSVCPDLLVRHRDIPITPVVQQMVIDELGPAAPRRPPSSVCS